MAGYEKTPKPWFENGAWAGMTLGELIRLLVDGGPTDIALVRVKGKTRLLDAAGAFRLTLEIELVPNGYVVDRMYELQVDLTHSDLDELIHKGVIK